MFTSQKHRHRDLVVDRGIRGHVHRRNIGVCHDLVEIGKDQRSTTEKSLDLPLAKICILGIEIAYGSEFD